MGDRSLAGDDLVGRTIADRYQIMSRLGAGGMGIAYRAWDSRTRALVVIKIPRPVFLVDPRFAERFSREVRLMQALCHSHIVPIVDVGEHDGLPFMVMRYLPGGSLSSRRLRDDQGVVKRNHPGMLHLWLPAIADALDHVHAQGVVHRDVKPANIFFDAFWQAFLGDFGIAKIVEDSAAFDRELTLTATHMGVGTQEYMAAEQFTPRAVIGARADQYALAITVYELLAASRPFTGATDNLILEIMTAPVPPLDRRVPALPMRLVQAVHRGLAKRPDERFASCAEFARNVLADVAPLADEPGVARLACPKCSHVIKIPIQEAGSRGRCTKCRKRLVIATDLGSLLTRDEEAMVSGQATTPWPSGDVATPEPVRIDVDGVPRSDSMSVRRRTKPPARKRLSERQSRQVAIGLGLLLVLAVMASTWWFWPRPVHVLDRRGRVVMDKEGIEAFPPKGWRRSEAPVEGAMVSFVLKSMKPVPCIRLLSGARPPASAKPTKVKVGDRWALTWSAPSPKLTWAGKLVSRVCATKVAGRDYSVEVTVPPHQADEAQLIANLVAGGLTPLEPTGPTVVKGLKAEYFKDKDLSEAFARGMWPTVDVDWSGGPPAGFPPANYSVRWTGFIVPFQTGLHTFSGTRDDGLRITIDGDTVVDEWVEGRADYVSREKFLKKEKRYSIRVEWYNGHGPGVCTLYWKGPIGEVELVPAECLMPGP